MHYYYLRLFHLLLPRQWLYIDTAHHHLGDDYNYDNFEFYDLAMHLTETEPVTLEPPLKVAWTYEFSSPFSAPPLPVSLIAENVVYLENDISIKAIDADTGELLWNKEWSANLAYKDGVLTPLPPINHSQKIFISLANLSKEKL
ncbi:MAG: PQQ-like beta-propeller repeat protein [Methanophagales archaeon]|nr:PQQ-like beta-propeller repeat protein [Methanophagales archaeon]